MKAESRQIPQKLAARLKFVYCTFHNLSLFFQITCLVECLQNSFPTICFPSLQKFNKMPFFFKHSNSELNMSVTWKVFDGVQRQEISISDVRCQFGFQSNKALFQWQFDCQMFVHYPWSKKNIIIAIITSQLIFKRLTTDFCYSFMFSKSIKQ